MKKLLSLAIIGFSIFGLLLFGITPIYAATIDLHPIFSQINQATPNDPAAQLYSQVFQ